MARIFNEEGIRAEALTGQSSPEDRQNAPKRLRNGELQVLFTVDLFNEGVDIPEIDCLLFLRPTESATVFIQQLGRGLRRAMARRTVSSSISLATSAGNSASISASARYSAEHASKSSSSWKRASPISRETATSALTKKLDRSSSGTSKRSSQQTGCAWSRSSRRCVRCWDEPHRWKSICARRDTTSKTSISNPSEAGCDCSIPRISWTKGLSQRSSTSPAAFAFSCTWIAWIESTSTRAWRLEPRT